MAGIGRDHGWPMTKDQWLLLLTMEESQDHGAFAVACDGTRGNPAHELEQLGYASWRGTNWGSSFWAITPAGREAIKNMKPESER